jgi:hypothetical protein
LIWGSLGLIWCMLIIHSALYNHVTDIILFEMNKYLKCSKRLAKCNWDLFWRRKEEVKSLS